MRLHKRASRVRPSGRTRRHARTRRAFEPPVVILGHQHRTLAAALAGRGSSGWGKDPHLDMFVRTAARRGLRVEEMETKRLAWHGLRNVSVLKVTPADPERAERDDADGDEPS